MRIKDQINPWGKSLEPQRSDLWKLDFSQVMSGLQIPTVSPLFPAHFYATKVNFPALHLKEVEVVENGVPVAYPDADQVCGEVRVEFIHDIGTGVGGISRSEIYTILEAWRSKIRAGRVGFSSESESIPVLDTNFKSNYAFDIPFQFVKGAGSVNDRIALLSSQTLEREEGDSSGVSDRMEIGAVYRMRKAWLSSFSLNEVSYGSGGIATIPATLFVRDIRQFT